MKKTFKFSYLHFLCLFISVSCLAQEANKIVLTPSMITKISGNGDVRMLVDEQAKEIIYTNNPPIQPQTEWEPGWGVTNYPASAQIDLGNEYNLERLAYFDSHDAGKLEFAVGSTQLGWTIISTQNQDKFLQWVSVPFAAKTRYLLVTVYAPMVVPMEVALFGKPANQAPEISAIANHSVELLKKTTIDVQVSDANGDISRIYLLDPPAFVRIEGDAKNSARIIVEPELASTMGAHELTLVAEDSYGKQATRTFEIAVKAVKNAKCTPAFSGIPEQARFEMNAALGRGVNFGGYLEAPREGQWRPNQPLSELLFLRTHQAGFCTIRLPVRWSNHAQVEFPYTIDEGFFKRVDFAVKTARAYGLNIIVDMHHYRQLSGAGVYPEVKFDEGETPIKVPSNDPWTLVDERFVAMWRQIAERYKNHGSEVLFELLNEPGLRFHRSNSALWTIYRRALDEIREVSPNRFVLLGPPSWQNAKSLFDPNDPNKLKMWLPGDGDNDPRRHQIIVSIHNYEPFNLTHAGTNEVSSPVDACCDATQLNKLKEALTLAQTWSNKKKIPINVGEFGAHAFGDRSARINYIYAAVREMNELGFSWNVWTMTEEWYLYDTKNHLLNQDFKSALMSE